MFAGRHRPGHWPPGCRLHRAKRAGHGFGVRQDAFGVERNRKRIALRDSGGRKRKRGERWWRDNVHIHISLAGCKRDRAFENQVQRVVAQRKAWDGIQHCRRRKSWWREASALVFRSELPGVRIGVENRYATTRNDPAAATNAQHTAGAAGRRCGDSATVPRVVLTDCCWPGLEGAGQEWLAGSAVAAL